MNQAKCAHCGKEFVTNVKNKRYCSTECYRIELLLRQREANKKRFETREYPVIKKCICCNGDIVVENRYGLKKLYCSTACCNEFNREHRNQLAREREAMNKSNKKIAEIKQKREGSKTIVELAVEARKHGMSYGQWVALQEAL